MMMSMIFIFISIYLFTMSSFNSLMFLLFIETLVLLAMFLLMMNFYSWFNLLMFLLISVCLGAFGISLLTCNSRSKGGVFFLSFGFKK